MKIRHHDIYESASKKAKELYLDELMVVLETISNISQVVDSFSSTEYMLTVASQVLCLISRADSLEELEATLDAFKKFLEL